MFIEHFDKKNKKCPEAINNFTTGNSSLLVINNFSTGNRPKYNRLNLTLKNAGNI